MNYHRLIELIDAGESLTVEFKRKFSTAERIAKELIAFANTAGGVVLFGVDDDKTIVGVESEKGEMELILHAVERHTEPEIQVKISIVLIQEKDVVCVEVERSPNRPHFLVNPSDVEDGAEPRAYIRVGENSIVASREMVKVLRHQTGSDGAVRLIVGEAERRLFNYFETHDRITVKEYAHLINVSDRRAARLLVRLVRAGSLAIHNLEKSDYYTLITRID